MLVPDTYERYVGDSQSLILEVDVDMLLFFEFMDYTKKMRLKTVAEMYIYPRDKTDKLVNIRADKDILDILNELGDGDTLDIYVTHVAPLMVIDINATGQRLVGQIVRLIKSL